MKKITTLTLSLLMLGMTFSLGACGGPSEFSVNFYDGDNVLFDQQNVKKGEAATTPSTNPSKTATAQYTYTFVKWVEDYSKITSDLDVHSTFSDSVNTFTVNFLGDNGVILETDVVEYGSAAVYNASTPVKTGSAQYSYAFNGWDKSYDNVTTDLNVNAVFVRSENSYTVTFYDGDNKQVGTDLVTYGSAASYKGSSAPTKASTAQYSYTFNSVWHNSEGEVDDLSNVIANRSVYAQFTSSVNKYDVTFKDYDGTVLDTEVVAYGSGATYNGVTPTREVDETSSYTFTGWDKDYSTITGDLEVFAQYDSQASVKCVFNNVSGEAVQTTYIASGNAAIYKGTTPTKEADSDYFYSFCGWDLNTYNVTENTTFSPVFVKLIAADDNGDSVNDCYQVSGITGACHNVLVPETYTVTETWDILKINNSAFEVDGIYSIDIGDKIKNIDSYAFGNCNSLCVVYIGSGLVGYNNQWVDGNWFIEKIYVDETNQYLSDIDGILYNKNQTVLLRAGGGRHGETGKTLTLPSTVTSLNQNSFYSNYTYTSIILNEGLTTIYDNAFSDTNLTTLNFPTTLVDCTGSSFFGNQKLASYSVTPGNPYFFSISGGLYCTKDSVTSLVSVPSAYNGDFTLYPTTEVINSYAVYVTYNMTSFTASSSLKTINTNSFNQMNSNCTTLDLSSSSLTSLPDYSLNGNNFTTLSLPSTIVSSGDGALSSNLKLKSITIPASWKTFGTFTFDACSALESVTFASGNTMTDLPSGTFQQCRKLASIDLPDTIETIGQRAFSYCVALTSITLPSSLKTLGESSFSCCFLLDSVTFTGSSLITIGYSAFFSTALTSVTIPSTVTTINGGAFYDTHLTSVIIPSSVTTLKNQIFGSCDSLASIYCEATSQPATWDTDWTSDIAYSGYHVYWFSSTSNTDGNHWHYVSGVPTVWVA